MVKKIADVVCICLILVSWLNAGVIRVPGDTATIQAGIDAAATGDTVLVAPGVYHETISFEGKAVTVGSFFLMTGDPDIVDETVLDADWEGSVVSFVNGETEASRLVGLTLVHGLGTLEPNQYYYGGGIFIKDASPTIGHCRIMHNAVGGAGGGVYCLNGSPVLDHVVISDNFAAFGGGIECKYSEMKIIRTLIAENTAESGGGMKVRYESRPFLMNVTVVNNMSTIWHGGGLAVDGGSGPVIVNGLLWDNLPQAIYFDGLNDPNEVAVAYSDVEGGAEGILTSGNGIVHWLEGNLDADPLFEAYGAGTYRLSAGPPCIDAGIQGAAVPYGNGSMLDVPEASFSGAAPDIGAFECMGSSAVTSAGSVPEAFALLGNFPNPFNGRTTISFDLPHDAFVRVTVFDALGRLVDVPAERVLRSGRRSVVFDAADGESGAYVYRIEAGRVSMSGKCLLVK